MPTLPKHITLKFYKREDIREAMVLHAKDKEIGMCYGEGYGKRPDVITYPRDVLELAMQGVSSLHCSEERWGNPLSLHSNLKRKELDELRIGWDLVLDIDCKIMEYSKICADLCIEFLKYCGVKDISCKFSGNKGFHIGVPFEAFPKNVGDKLTREMFPEAPKKIALYITENIKHELARRIIEFEEGDFSRVKEKVQLTDAEIIHYTTNNLGDKQAYLNVEPFLEIDTILISSRHLYRMPYSLHEKSGLVSIPIDPNNIMEFEKPMARPESVLTPMFTFIDRNVTEESARRLLVQALDFEVKIKEDRVSAKRFEEVTITSPIREEFFPPCITKILAGMEDGKKRAVFILINFLGKLGWNKEEIRTFLDEWNKKNPEPLREVYIRGQLNNFVPGAKLPPNCDNEGYYRGLGLKCDGNWCKGVKNPVNYTLSKWRRHLWYKEQEKGQGKNQGAKSKAVRADSGNDKETESGSNSGSVADSDTPLTPS